MENQIVSVSIICLCTSSNKLKPKFSDKLVVNLIFLEHAFENNKLKYKSLMVYIKILFLESAIKNNKSSVSSSFFFKKKKKRKENKWDRSRAPDFY
jgi:hypothetical protein